MKQAPSSHWAESNRELHRSRCRGYSKRYRDKLGRLILDAKRKPCIDCGIGLPPEVMDLDHVRGTKLFALGQWMKSPVPDGFSSRAEAITAEIAKCDVRCPNCHRLRHFQQDQSSS